MVKVNHVKKKLILTQRDIIKFQIMNHCFVNDIQLSNSELDCLTLLGVCGLYELAEFCNIAVEENIFKTAQTVRNFLSKAESLGLINKEGTNKKKISLKDTLKIQTTGNILLDIRAIYATQE